MVEGVPARIRERRKFLDLTQRALADKLGVSLTTVTDWETGKADPNYSNLIALSQVFGVSTDWLLKGEGPVLKIIERPKRKSSEAIIHELVSKMPSFKIEEYQEAGLAAAAGHGFDREVDSSQLEPGTYFSADAIEPRVVTARGISGEELARDGQQVVIDVAVTNVGVDEPCVVLTRDGKLRLKRKTKDLHGKRRYQSINREFPTLEVMPRDVVAEFPVVTVLLRSRQKSPVETFDEGFPV